MNRRMFLMAGAGMSVASAAPADQVVLGVIGSGSRGTFVMSVFQKDPSLRIGAICDVYEPNLEKALSTAAKAQPSPPVAYRNYKELLADKNIQAVLIATPEHWHAQMVLDALAAGKDVYVEKPLCQTPEQGVKLVEAETNTKSIIQVGMQRRSYDLYLEGRDVVASGQLGTVRMVRSWWLNNYLGDRRQPGSKGLSIGSSGRDRRRGVAPDPDRFLHWRFYSEYSGGILADQGAHVFDGIHLLMGAGFPSAVNASAGKPHRAAGNTPESVVAIAEYPQDFIAVFSVNYAAMQYKLAERSIEPARRRSRTHGYWPRRTQNVPEGIRGRAGDREEIPQGFRIRDRSACAEFSRVRTYAQNSHCAHARGIPGRACGPNGEHVIEKRPALQMECRRW